MTTGDLFRVMNELGFYFKDGAWVFDSANGDWAYREYPTETDTKKFYATVLKKHPTGKVEGATGVGSGGSNSGYLASCSRLLSWS